MLFFQNLYNFNRFIILFLDKNLNLYGKGAYFAYISQKSIAAIVILYNMGFILLGEVLLEKKMKEQELILINLHL